MLLAVVCWLFVGCAIVGGDRVPEPECPLAAAEAVMAQSVPELLLAKQHAGRALLIGEHHGQTAEIDLLATLIEEQAAPVLVAMELLPAAAQPQLDALLEADRFVEADWLAVVGKRYWPAPLHVQAYARVVAAARSARGKGVDVRLVGLAPDCRLGPMPTTAAAMDCFRERDAAMLRTLRAARKAHPDHGLIVSAGWRHLSAVRLPSAPKVLGESWPAHWPATRVLLTAPERALPTGGWVSTCGAAPTSLANARQQAVAVDLSESSAQALTLASCLDLPSADDRPLSKAFDLLVALPPGAAPQALGVDEFARIAPADRAAWARTYVELMGRSQPPQTPQEWASWASADVADLAAQLTPAPGCPSALPASGG